MFTKNEARKAISPDIAFIHSTKNMVWAYEPLSLEYQGSALSLVLTCRGIVKQRVINKYMIDVCVLLDHDKMPGTSLMDAEKAYLFKSWWDAMANLGLMSHEMNLHCYREFPTGKKGLPVDQGLKVIHEKWQEAKGLVLALYLTSR